MAKLLYLLCALAATAVSSYAQPLQVSDGSVVLASKSSTVTLPEAVARALAHSPEISIASREVEATGGLVRQAGVIPNPELAYLVEDLKKETRTTTIQINQPIELGGKRSARVAAAERTADIARSALQTKRIDVRTRVIAAFYAALSAQERYKLAKDTFALADKAMTIAAKRVAAGKVSPLEETRARIARADARVELAQSATESANARGALASLWGARQPDFDAVDGAVSELPAVPTWDRLASQLPDAPDLAQARIELERRRALVSVERTKRIGDITLTVGNKRDETLGRDQTVVGFSIPLPIFDRNQGNLQEALSREGQAEDELNATAVRTETALSQAYQHLKSAHEEAQLYQTEVLPDATTAYNAATKGFEYGKFSFLDVLDAQRTLCQAKSQYLRALSSAHSAAADIERLIGADRLPE
jgi:cobalt-zinc-cadmium efflux system outer membrane protein